MKEIELLKKIIEESHNIVLFTGAGFSVPSGIKDFRSSDGLYSKKYKRQYSPEEILSHSFFFAHTDIFYEYYKENLINAKALPNEAHLLFARLEKEGKLKAVITQNIDCLHTMAGSKEVLELHGSVAVNTCLKCGKKWGLEKIVNSNGIPHCDCGGILKPDVVLYEEGLDMEVLEKSVYYIEHADTLIISGTSLVVQPASSLVRYFRGKNLVVINKSATYMDSIADLVIYDDVEKVIKSLEEIL